MQRPLSIHQSEGRRAPNGHSAAPTPSRPAPRRHPSLTAVGLPCFSSQLARRSQKLSAPQAQVRAPNPSANGAASNFACKRRRAAVGAAPLDEWRRTRRPLTDRVPVSCAQEVLDSYILTANSRGAMPKQVPSKLNGTFEYFTSPYEQKVITWCAPSHLPEHAAAIRLGRPSAACAPSSVARVPIGGGCLCGCVGGQPPCLCAHQRELMVLGCVRVVRTPSYVMGALKKEAMEKVPWIAPVRLPACSLRVGASARRLAPCSDSLRWLCCVRPGGWHPLRLRLVRPGFQAQRGYAPPLLI
jgi:hypothetical protein